MYDYKSCNNSINNIIELKQNLMAANPKTDNSLSLTRQAINEKTGKIFEKNIRCILENMFGFKSMKYPDKIFTKKIRIEKGNNNEEKDIFQNEETAFNINNKRYIFLFAQNFELIVRDQNNSEISKILSEQSNKESKINIEGIGVTISPYKEMEIDGYFRMGKFEVNMFDYNEIEVLFSNVKKEEEKYYIYCIIEAKLGENKVDELIKQIRKDHNLLKIKDIKNTILIGFINSIKIKDRNHFNSLGKKNA